MNFEIWVILLSFMGAIAIGTLTWILMDKLLRKLVLGILISNFFEKIGKTNRKLKYSFFRIFFMAIGVAMICILQNKILFFIFTLVIFGDVGRAYYPTVEDKIRKKNKIRKLKELFPQTIGMMIQALKAGQTIQQVLEYLSKESPAPLKEEWIQVCMEMNLGASSEQALNQMELRYPEFLDFQQFLQAYKISRQTGANLTHLLEILLEGMEQKNRLLRKMDAMTAQAKLSGLLMGLLPFILGFVFFLMDPTLLSPLVTEKLGWGILLLSVVMETIGFFWIRQLLQIEV
jgi:tight adherence protein B